VNISLENVVGKKNQDPKTLELVLIIIFISSSPRLSYYNTTEN